MKRGAIMLLAAMLALGGCKTETAARPDPVPMTETAIGHFCQMNLLDHPGPKAQVHLEGVDNPLFFSQVRDAVAYRLMPEQDYPITAVYVSDMGRAPGWDDPGATNWTDAETAWFVVGSGRDGGMGAAETVPFADRTDAEAFAARNGGTLMRLAEIPAQAVLSPAGGPGNTSGPGAAASAEAAAEADFQARLKALSSPSTPEPKP